MGQDEMRNWNFKMQRSMEMKIVTQVQEVKTARKKKVLAKIETIKYQIDGYQDDQSHLPPPPPTSSILLLLLLHDMRRDSSLFAKLYVLSYASTGLKYSHFWRLFS